MVVMKFRLYRSQSFMDSLKRVGFISSFGDFKLKDQAAACDFLSRHTGATITPGDHIWEINVDLEDDSLEHMWFLLKWS